jgi:DNA polymerase-1
MNRHADPTKQNQFVPVIRKLAVMEDLAIESVGREADDLIRTWTQQAINAGDDYIICTIDKDMDCIPGLHYRMHPKIEGKSVALNHPSRFVEISPEDSMRFYYEQLLKGDPTDNIPGVPRIGDVKAKKILAPYNTKEEFQEQVVEQYMLAYGDEWKDYLLSNAKMIHLQTDTEDYFSFKDWPIIGELCK